MQDEERYYIKDEVLESITDDEFGHKDFASVLKEIIDKQKTPLNIGIFGKWGVGKSSIVSLFKELIEDKLVRKEGDTDDSEKIAFVSIPVWKYTQTKSLRNKFMFNIAKGLYADIAKLRGNIYGTRTVITSLLFKPEYLFDELKKLKKNFPWKLLIISFIIATVLIYLAKLIDSLSIILIYGLASALSIFINVFKSARVNISYSKFDSDEQFENEFARMIEKRKCKKVIFIDDLDRCSIDKVVETLETIKTFLEIPRCVFIIACDNKIIEQAIDGSNKIYKRSEENNGAQYLEKFFQYAITVPPFIRQDMREYARNILEKQKSKLLELRDIDDILFVLIHGGVINPRKAIVLINSFVSDYLVIKKREKDPESKLNPDTITSHLPVLAKLTVLKHDYPDFYLDLEKNKDLIKWMTAYIDGEEKSLLEFQKTKCQPYISDLIVSEEGKETFSDRHKQWDESVYVESKARRTYQLYNFLSTTRENDRDIKDLRPFMFLGQDSASYGMADEYLESINAALRAGQVLPIKNILEAEKKEHQTDTSNIVLDWIEQELAGPELGNGVRVLSECLPVMSEDVLPRASRILINKTMLSGIKERIKTLNIQGMFFASTKVKKRQSIVVNRYIESLSHEDLNFSKKILDGLFEYESLVKSPEQIKKVQSFLEKRGELEGEE